MTIIRADLINAREIAIATFPSGRHFFKFILTLNLNYNVFKFVLILDNVKKFFHKFLWEPF